MIGGFWWILRKLEIVEMDYLTQNACTYATMQISKRMGYDIA
jgi:hypothetical protein